MVMMVMMKVVNRRQLPVGDEDEDDEGASDHRSASDDGDGDGEDGELASDQRRSVRFRRKQGVSTGRAFKLSRCRNMMNIGIFNIIIVIITIIIIIIIGDQPR